MLEHPSIPHYGSVRNGRYRDNVTGADNQQERLRLEGWVSGFIDGEGCFCVNINRCSATRLGWQVRPEFVVTQGARSIGALETLEAFFGCGAIYRNTRRDNHREDVYRWCVRRRHDLVDRVVPFVASVPLRTSKAADFEQFARILALMGDGRHLELTGVAEIAALVQRMNTKKPSVFLRILRDCTPTASCEVKIQSVLHGDMERSAEMSGPLVARDDQSKPGAC
jgi:LAGLIDADG endonuclease